jgi:predicted RND superfamily exporter protein
MIRFASMRPRPRAAPWLLLLAFAAPAAASLAALPRLRFDHDARSLLLECPSEDASERDLAASFGSDDILLVAWPVDDLLAPETFDELRRVTDAVARVEGVEETYSLASGGVPLPLDRLRPIEREDLVDPARRDAVRRALRASTVYAGTLYAEALDVVAVATTVRPGPRDAREAAVRQVREAVARLLPGREAHVAGVTALAMDAGAYAVADLRRVGGLALLATIAALLVLRRSAAEAAVAVTSTGLPPLYALGLAAAAGHPVTALGAALFPVLAIVGVTTSVYLLEEHARGVRRGLDAHRAAFAAARRLRAPIALSLLTTAAGFLTLRVTGVPAFRDAGTTVGLGVLAAIPVVLLGTPALLAATGLRPRRRRRGGLHRPMIALGRRALAAPAPVALGALAACALGAGFALRAPVRADVFQAFRPATAVARTYRFLDERLTATLPVDAVLRTAPGTPIADVLHDLESFARAARSLPGVDSALSLASLVRYGASILRIEGDVLEKPAALDGVLLVLRTAFARIARRFEQTSGEGGGGRYRVKVRVREGTHPRVLDGLADAAARMRSGSASLTGLYVRAVRTARALLRNLAQGAGAMLGVVAVTVALALRSWRAGVAAVLPNLLPPAVVFGAASLLGGHLDVSAIAVGGVAIGLSVDNTLHLLFRARGLAARGHSGRPLLLRALAAVARPLSLSTAVLALGLAVLAQSSFLPTARFGLLTAATAVAALLGAVVVLPATARAFRAL